MGNEETSLLVTCQKRAELILRRRYLGSGDDSGCSPCSNSCTRERIQYIRNFRLQHDTVQENLAIINKEFSFIVLK